MSRSSPLTPTMTWFLIDDGRDGGIIHLVEIADGFAPRFLAVVDVQRDQIAVGRFEVEPVAVDADAAVAEMDAALGVPGVVPDLAAGAGVDGPDLVGDGEVHDAVDDQRSRFMTPP